MKKLLVVVDYQNDFVSGSLGFPKAAQLEEAIIKKIEDYRAAGDDVVFTLDTHGPDYLSTQEGKNLPVEHCIKGTDGWQLYGKVAALAKTAQPQTPVLVDARCTAALDEETNEKTLDVMAGFQVRIVGR